MAQSILIFDFGTNEEAAQQARHKVEAWKQGFRLGNKIQLKFEREEAQEDKDPDAEIQVAKAQKGKKKTSAPAKNLKHNEMGGAKDATDPNAEAGNDHIRLLIRLDFSDHEKLSHQRWLDRIPNEEPFKSAASETLRAGDPEFAKTGELFDSLD